MLDNKLDFDRYLIVKNLIHDCSCEILKLYENTDIHSFIYKLRQILDNIHPRPHLKINELSDITNYISNANMSVLETIHDMLLSY